MRYITEGVPSYGEHPLIPLVIFEFFEPFSHVFDGLLQAVFPLDDIHGLLEAYDEGCYEVPTRSCSLLSDS